MKPKEGEVTSRPWHWPINYQVCIISVQVFIESDKSCGRFILSYFANPLPFRGSIFQAVAIECTC